MRREGYERRDQHSERLNVPKTGAVESGQREHEVKPSPWADLPIGHVIAKAVVANWADLPQPRPRLLAKPSLRDGRIVGCQ